MRKLTADDSLVLKKSPNMYVHRVKNGNYTFSLNTL